MAEISPQLILSFQNSLTTKTSSTSWNLRSLTIDKLGGLWSSRNSTFPSFTNLVPQWSLLTLSHVFQIMKEVLVTMTPLLSYTLNTFVIHLASMPAVPWLKTSIFILTLPSNCLTDTPLPLAGRLLMGLPVGSTGLLFLTYHPYVNASSERAKIPFLRATLDALKPLSWFCTTSGGHLLQKTATNVLMAAQPASAPNPSIKPFSLLSPNKTRRIIGRSSPAILSPIYHPWKVTTP